MMEGENTELFDEREPVHFGTLGFISLAVCLLCALWRILSYNVFELYDNYLPGIGLTVTVTAMLVLAAAVAKRSGFLHITPCGIVCLVCTEGVALTYALYGSFQMRLTNLFVVPAFYVYTLYVLTSPDGSAVSFRGLVNAAGRAFANCFRSLPVPFRALSEAKKKRGSRVSADAIIGVVIAVIVLPIVLILLASADEMFSHAFDALFDTLDSFNRVTVWRALFLGIPLGLILFSQVFSPSLREEAPVQSETAPVAPSMFTVTLIGLTAAFMLFGFIQVKYLFLGREAALMEGGFAQYARSGFFQLVGVAFIALIVVQPALALSGDKRVIRVLCLTVSLLTELIVVSAFLRMRLYIAEYGLTILRALVLWAIGILCVCFGAAAFKSVKPGTKIFAFLLLLVMVSWTLLSLANPARIIAEHNVSAYESGTLAHVDVPYLRDLLPSSFHALERIGEDPHAEFAWRKNSDHANIPPSFQWAFEFPR